MNKEDICFMSASDVLEKIKTQELSSQEITEIVIERIEKINPIINAYCTPTFEWARDTAKKADDAVKKGEELGSLQGIPTSIKDEMPIKGIRTTFGSKLYENNIPDEDDACVERLKDIGAVILGKTNMSPFGFLHITDNLIFGETHNPWDLERTPGGPTFNMVSSFVDWVSSLATGMSLTALTVIVNVWSAVVNAAPPAVASSVSDTVTVAEPFASSAGV